MKLKLIIAALLSTCLISCGMELEASQSEVAAAGVTATPVDRSIIEINNLISQYLIVKAPAANITKDNVTNYLVTKSKLKNAIYLQFNAELKSGRNPGLQAYERDLQKLLSTERLGSSSFFQVQFQMNVNGDVKTTGAIVVKYFFSSEAGGRIAEGPTLQIPVQTLDPARIIVEGYNVGK